MIRRYKKEKHPAQIMMRVSFLCCFRIRVLLASSSLLIFLLFAVNGLTLTQLSQKFGRLNPPINRSRTDNRLWMATKTTSNVVSSNDKGVGNLPKLKKKLTREFFSIGFPAFIQLAAEPLAALVDTAYLGGFYRVFLEASLFDDAMHDGNVF